MILFRNLLLGVIGLSLLMGIYGRRGLIDYYRLKNQSQEFDQKLKEARIAKDALEFELEAFKKDRQTQERTVREVLGYLKKNEKVIEFP